MLLFLNVIYVLIAISMVALILMQRGAGAQAGSGFGGGASATVFGSRGASNFLSKATKWLGITFFAISLFMAYRATDLASGGAQQFDQDLGVMSQAPVVPATPQDGGTAVPSAPVQQAPADSVPQAPAADSAVPALPVEPPPAQDAPPPAD
ncbi:preprotein translocase subunit SecG [Lysobacter sp. D1-1-M9]|uniref:preprotein translocase subunit SecG n=1 Tax=Novilysobacter longmucuonensis TaxID=3098603 RepID=UPI002FC598EF